MSTAQIVGQHINRAGQRYSDSNDLQARVVLVYGDPNFARRLVLRRIHWLRAYPHGGGPHRSMWWVYRWML